MSPSPRRKVEYNDDILPEYDFSGAVRGKYTSAIGKGPMLSFSSQISPLSFAIPLP